jgi:DNA-3-methyladenine glycosylase
MSYVLPLEFYVRDEVVMIARDLLGKVLCTELDGEYTSGIITETEAYAGVNDRASHAYGGRRTDRTEIMYRQGGTAYVYLCYGVHSLFNVVTSVVNNPHAVLIRSVKPLEGLEVMQKRTGRQVLSAEDGIGPGKLTRLLGIHYRHSGLSLLKENLLVEVKKDNMRIWIEERSYQVPEEQIRSGPRIGVHYAGADAGLPYRFIFRNVEIG